MMTVFQIVARASRRLARPVLATACLFLAGIGSVQYASAAPATAGTDSAPAAVLTHAIVRAITVENPGQRTYISLRILPRDKLPFTTLTFLVPDPALVKGLAQGANVAFRAERRQGENTLVHIEPAPPCEKYRPCQ